MMRQTVKRMIAGAVIGTQLRLWPEPNIHEPGKKEANKSIRGPETPKVQRQTASEQHETAPAGEEPHHKRRIDMVKKPAGGANGAPRQQKIFTKRNSDEQPAGQSIVGTGPNSHRHLSQDQEIHGGETMAREPRNSTEPLHRAKLTRKLLDELPTGQFIASNVCMSPESSAYTAYVRPEKDRAAQWQEIVACRVNHRLCAVFQNELQYRRYQRELLKTLDSINRPADGNTPLRWEKTENVITPEMKRRWEAEHRLSDLPPERHRLYRSTQIDHLPLDFFMVDRERKAVSRPMLWTVTDTFTGMITDAVVAESMGDFLARWRKLHGAPETTPPRTRRTVRLDRGEEKR
jgi:hypothetical protein